MGGHDYTLVMRYRDGKVVQDSYQSMLKRLNIANETLVLGLPLSKGLVPQVQAIATLIKKASGGQLSGVGVLFNGQPILEG